MKANGSLSKSNESVPVHHRRVIHYLNKKETPKVENATNSTSDATKTAENTTLAKNASLNVTLSKNVTANSTLAKNQTVGNATLSKNQTEDEGPEDMDDEPSAKNGTKSEFKKKVESKAAFVAPVAEGNNSKPILTKKAAEPVPDKDAEDMDDEPSDGKSLAKKVKAEQVPTVGGRQEIMGSHKSSPVEEKPAKEQDDAEEMDNEKVKLSKKQAQSK